ncbi:MAG: hypothetical protein ACOVP1_14200 [Bacteroidia bacterium]
MENRRKKIEQMLLESPEDVFLNYALAMEFKSENNLEQAIIFFKKCIEIHGSHTASMYQLALIFEELGQMKQVLFYLNKGIAILKQTNDRKTLNEFLTLKAMNFDEDE